jgi:hypothetical protein
MWNFIAETPWWLPTGLALVGAALAWNGNNRQERKLKYAGLALLALALLVGGVSYVLDSDRERITKNTKRIITATGNRDWATVEKLLHPKVRVIAWEGRDELLRGAKRYAEQYNFKDARTGLMTVPEPVRNSSTATVQVFSNISDMSNFITNWEMEWVKQDDAWLLREIRPVGSPFIANMDRYFNQKP